MKPSFFHKFLCDNWYLIISKVYKLLEPKELLTIELQHTDAAYECNVAHLQQIIFNIFSTFDIAILVLIINFGHCSCFNKSHCSDNENAQ